MLNILNKSTMTNYCKIYWGGVIFVIIEGEITVLSPL